MIKIKIKKKEPEQLEEITARQAVIGLAAAANILATGVSKAIAAPRQQNISQTAGQKFTPAMVENDFNNAKRYLIDHYKAKFVQDKISAINNKNVKPHIPKILNIINSAKIYFLTTDQMRRGGHDVNADAEAVFANNSVFVNKSFFDDASYAKSLIGKDRYYSLMIHELNHLVYNYLEENHLIKDSEETRKLMVSAIQSKIDYAYEDEKYPLGFYGQYAYMSTEQASRILELRSFLNLPSDRSITKEQLINSLKDKGVEIIPLQSGGKIYYGMKFDQWFSPDKKGYSPEDLYDLRRDFYRFLNQKFKGKSFSIDMMLRSVFTGFNSGNNPSYQLYGIDLDKLVEYFNQTFAAREVSKTGLPA